MASLAGDVAEKLCVDELAKPYFWTKEKERNPSIPVVVTILEALEKIESEMRRLDLLLVTNASPS